MSEPTSAPSLRALTSFATWAPLLRAWTDGRHPEAGAGAEAALHLSGAVGPDVLRASGGVPPHVRDAPAAAEAVERVREAVVAAAAPAVTFSARIGPSGRTVLRVTGTANPAVEAGPAGGGALLLVEGAVPEPWRRLPDPAPTARPARPGDLAALERWLLERLPAAGVTDEEFAAAEARLGLALPEELKVLYRVTGARQEDWDQAVYDTLGLELLPLAEVHVADAASRPAPWRYAAREAVVAPPGAAVQQLVGSPGWIAFADNGGGDLLAVDLTPGPGGRTGQIVVLSHELLTGAELVADSLHEALRGIAPQERTGTPAGTPRAVAHLPGGHPRGVEAAAHPGLEVLHIGADGPPADLTPLAGLPRLRTLVASPGALADPRQIGRLDGLEYLETGPAEWRILLDAGAVPRGLAAAAVTPQGLDGPEDIVGPSNEILALWKRPPIVRAVLHGDLRPPAETAS
jgi:cell wall assembly regulator SMI1